MTDTSAVDVTVAKLAKVYVRIRDKRKELADQDEKLEEQLKLVSGEILELCKKQGVTTMRTEYGTISQRVTKTYWTNDWDALYTFIKKHDALPLLQQRIHTGNMEQFLKDNPEAMPPGLNANVTQTVVITKKA